MTIQEQRIQDLSKEEAKALAKMDYPRATFLANWRLALMAERQEQGVRELAA